MTDQHYNSEEEFIEQDAPSDQETNDQDSGMQKVLHIKNMFEEWYLDYASYVNLDRAVPDIFDGLKPVQRRILHSMKELEDGRYNKVANIIGNTMKYHPHGDAAIGDALVNLGQKELLIDCQGNWGNILTGDGAAAPRYIEARLTKFALEVVFNAKTTKWKQSYDSRNREPICLPIKFPLLLAQGVEGIGVGLSSLILPHNFNELIDASINVLQGKDFEIYPDFPTGGYVDVNGYQFGMREGRVKIRAKIEVIDKKTLAITELPFGTTTEQMIDSIEKACEKGRLSLKKIFDKTAAKAEIILHLAPNASTDQTIDALYAFTECQKSIAPNACVVENNKPVFVDVKYILRVNTQTTMDLLKLELEILLGELNDQWHWISLEKLFFEKRIYKELEKDQDSFEIQIDNIERAFDPYRKLFKKEIVRDDVLRLTEKPVRKISKFDIKKADEELADIEANIDEVSNHLAHLVDYTINYFKNIKKKYGQDKIRKTEIRNFDNITVPAVAIANQKLYVDKINGFVGIGLKKNESEYVCDCSDIDEIIAFKEDGTFIVTKVADKQFVGKNILHIDVFTRNDDRTVYNLIYSNGKNGTAYAKRFSIGGITRDKDYLLTQGVEGSKILHFSANKNGEAETVKITLKPKPKLKKTVFDFDFRTLAIKGRSSMGNIVSRNAVSKVVLTKKGTSTLGAREIWFDNSVNKINTEERGFKLGDFTATDKVIAYYKSGYYKITGFDSSIHFDDDLFWVEKLNLYKPITVIYLDTEKKRHFIKRVLPELTEKRIDLISKEQKQEAVILSINHLPVFEVNYYLRDKKDKHRQEINAEEFVEVMKTKAKGKRLPFDNILSINELEPLPYEDPSAKEVEIEQQSDDISLYNAPDSFMDDEESNGDPGVQMSLFD